MNFEFNVRDKELTAIEQGIRISGFNEGLINNLGNDSYSLEYNTGVYGDTSFKLTAIPLERTKKGILSWHVSLSGWDRQSLKEVYHGARRSLETDEVYI